MGSGVRGWLPRVRRPWALVYGLVAYVVAVRAMVYLVGFCTGWLVPKGIDSGPVGERGAALAIDVGLLAAFAVLHSLSARSGWKRRLGRSIPAALERSTYTLLAGLSLSALMWLWRPLPEPLWRIEAEWLRAALTGASAAGWVIGLIAILTLGHLDLFGLRPAYRYAIGAEPEDRGLVERGLYARVRNPLYAGFLVGVWSAPVMSVGRFTFALLATAYIVVGVGFEEADLARRLGDDYLAFKRRVPRFWPRLGRLSGAAPNSRSSSRRAPPGGRRR